MESTRGRKPPHRSRLGAAADGGQRPEAKPAGVAGVRAGAEAEAGPQPDPEKRAAAAERGERGAQGAGQGSDGGPGAPGFRDDESHEASSDSDGDLRELDEQEQPVQAAAQALQPGHRPEAGQQPSFTDEQVQELERVFGRTNYPDVAVRQELARLMNVPAARVRAWFKKRRARWRRQWRAVMVRNARPVAQAPPVIVTSATPFNAVPLPQPVWICCPVPLPLWMTLLPAPPFPPLAWPAPPLVLAPLPPWGPPPRGWAWFLTSNGPFLAPVF